MRPPGRRAGCSKASTSHPGSIGLFVIRASVPASVRHSRPSRLVRLGRPSRRKLSSTEAGLSRLSTVIRGGMPGLLTPRRRGAPGGAPLASGRQEPPEGHPSRLATEVPVGHQQQQRDQEPQDRRSLVVLDPEGLTLRWRSLGWASGRAGLSFRCHDDTPWPSSEGRTFRCPVGLRDAQAQGGSSEFMRGMRLGN
jgi:hypothetical protein